MGLTLNLKNFLVLWLMFSSEIAVSSSVSVLGHSWPTISSVHLIEDTDHSYHSLKSLESSNVENEITSGQENRKNQKVSFDGTNAEILSIPVGTPTTLRMTGSNLAHVEAITFTPKGGQPGQPCKNISEANGMSGAQSQFLFQNATIIDVRIHLPLPAFTGTGNDHVHPYLYICAKQREQREKRDSADHEWIHQGERMKLIPVARSGGTLEVRIISSAVLGIRGESSKVALTDDGVTLIESNVPTPLRIFGTNFSRYTILAFTTAMRPRGSSCDELPTVLVYHVPQDEIVSENVLEINIELPELSEDDDYYYICVKELHNYGGVSADSRWIHQGDDRWMRIKTHGRLLPLWLQIIIITFLLILSGLFSGLNLGLMSLDKTELQVIASSGTEKERKYAQAIAPLRNQGNYLLCTLLLGNVLVNSTLTVLLDDLTTGIVAVIVSTMSIVIFGEIIPQAFCSRHGLAIGARTILITKFFMFFTFPLSFPISKVLDVILGEEIGNVYDRERLIEFIKVTKDYSKLENEEMNIISGALELKRKTVAEVMTKIEDVFMIKYDAILDFETMSEIMKQGYTRIPVYDGDRNNIVAILHAKDLAFVDPDDNTPLKTLCEFYNHPIHFVFEDQTLDVMLNEFKTGKSHMAFVRRITTQGDADPKYEVTGVVTLEDIIEEIIQSEIIDETDVLTDNRRKQHRKEAFLKQDFSDFAKIGGGQGKNSVSPQLVLATYQYLSTSVAPFRRNMISETVLKRLMTQNIFFSQRVRKDEIAEPLYRIGQPAEYFILVLEGRVRVTVGKENLEFEAGPFTSFGIQALLLDTPGGVGHPESWNQNQISCLGGTVETVGSRSAFIPDYNVIPIVDILYVKISSAVYLSAYRATKMERQNQEVTVGRGYPKGALPIMPAGDEPNSNGYVGGGERKLSRQHSSSPAASPNVITTPSFPHTFSFSSLSQASVTIDASSNPHQQNANNENTEEGVHHTQQSGNEPLQRQMSVMSEPACFHVGSSPELNDSRNDECNFRTYGSSPEEYNDIPEFTYITSSEENVHRPNHRKNE